jgi:site-specific recombinase XerD
VARTLTQEFKCGEKQFMPCLTSSLCFGSIGLYWLHVQLARQELIDDEAGIAAKAAHDRRHELPQHVAEHPESLHLCRCKLHTFHGRSPDKLGIEDIRQYRLHLMARGLKPASINPIIGALRFFYGVTLGQKEIAAKIPFARKEDALPAVLTQDEVVRLLKAETTLKMRTALTTIYAAGLRVSEVVALTIKDIDSTRMVIHIREAKGRKDRYVMLSEQLLANC